jgi:hypothetical protein
MLLVPFFFFFCFFKLNWTTQYWCIIKSANYISFIIVYFLLGNSLASEFYTPTFQNILSHLHRQVGVKIHTYLPIKMEQTECSKTPAYKIQMRRNYPEENIQHTEHGKSLKSTIYFVPLHNLSPSGCSHYLLPHLTGKFSPSRNIWIYSM